MTHFEFTQAYGKQHSQCSAHHMTFEGRCLNCGYDPAKHGQTPKPKPTNTFRTYCPHPLSR